MNDFEIIKFMGSIFTPDLIIRNSLEFMNVVSELIGDKVGHNPNVLPIPQEAPPEIPRIQFVTPDKIWRLTISLERTDFVYFNTRLSDDDRVSTEDFSVHSSNFFSAFVKKLKIRVQRLAFITERVSPKQNPSQLIIGKFCKEEYYEKEKPFYNANRFEIHSLKNYKWNDFRLNSWVRVKAIDFLPKDEKVTVPVIHVENDMNTLSIKEDPDSTFSEDEITRFFNLAPQELQGILDKYFSKEKG